jgi:trans-aconitate methyltransferase
MYLSRKLRFSDMFQEKYKKAFRIDDKVKILEIGCGPGAFAQALHRWYPNAEIIGLDKDGNFIAFASRQAPQIAFMEGDATYLPCFIRKARNPNYGSLHIGANGF